MSKLFYTTAPEAYDYWYVTTVRQIGDWRLIEVTDEIRFRNCQTPRYESGLHTAVEADSERARELGLAP